MLVCLFVSSFLSFCFACQFQFATSGFGDMSAGIASVNQNTFHLYVFHLFHLLCESDVHYILVRSFNYAFVLMSSTCFPPKHIQSMSVISNVMKLKREFVVLENLMATR